MNIVLKNYLRALTALILIIASFALKAQQGFITTRGKEVIGPNNKPFLMKGTNLGNWLIPEGYMFLHNEKTKINSPRLINEALEELIGPDATKAFWQKYLDNYFT